MALLAPSVASAPGSTGMAANGNRARNNNFMIDGTDNNDISVTLQTVPVPPESVTELVVQTNPFNVEYGRNSGAQINVVTRGGSNQFHGNAFEYYRDSDLNARDNLEKASNLTEPTPFTRHQFGAGIGGPIVRNRAFFYGLFQRDNNEADSQGAATRVPTPAGFAALQNAPLRAGQSAASRQAVLQRLGFLQDLYGNNPAFRTFTNQTVNGVPIETAITQVTRATPVKAWYYVARGDFALGDGNHVTGRYIRNTPDSGNATSNTAFGSLFAADQTIVDQNMYASHTKVLGTTTLNEARFSWINRDLQFPENDPDSPTAGITGLFTIGGLSNFPQGRVQDSFQFMDVLTFQKGRHSFKAGADIRYIDLDNVSAFDSKGTFTFNSLQDYMNNNAVTFAQALQTSSFVAQQWSQFYFLQDDWRPTPTLTLNLGLRYENSTVPLGYLRRHRSAVARRARAWTGEARQRQLRAPRRLRLEPVGQRRLREVAPGRDDVVDSRRLREELRRALLQHPHGEREQLPARRRRPARQRTGPLPEHRARQRRGGLQPAGGVCQLARGHGEPGDAQLEPVVAAGAEADLRARDRLHGQPGPQRRLAGPGQLRRPDAMRRSPPCSGRSARRRSRPCSSAASSRSTARGR